MTDLLTREAWEDFYAITRGRLPLMADRNKLYASPRVAAALNQTLPWPAVQMDFDLRDNEMRLVRR